MADVKSAVRQIFFAGFRHSFSTRNFLLELGGLLGSVQKVSADCVKIDTMLSKYGCLVHHEEKAEWNEKIL